MKKIVLNVVNFYQPLLLKLNCRSIYGWPIIKVEVWLNDSIGKKYKLWYGTGFLPIKSGFTIITINCWRKDH